MRARPGRTFLPALLLLAGAGLVLYIAAADWMRLTAALLLLLGIALGVFAIATPDYLAAGEDEDS